MRIDPVKYDTSQSEYKIFTYIYTTYHAHFYCELELQKTAKKRACVHSAIRLEKQTGLLAQCNSQ